METPQTNQSWSEQYRMAAKDWVDKESAAAILEETKSAILSQKMLEHSDLPVSRAKMQVSGSDEWIIFLNKMNDRFFIRWIYFKPAFVFFNNSLVVIAEFRRVYHSAVPFTVDVGQLFSKLVAASGCSF